VSPQRLAVVIRLPVVVPISTFTAIAWYNVLALNVVIWLTFKRRSGLYFYTLLVASWGIAFHELGFLMLFFNITKSFAASMVVITVGWYSMVNSTSSLISLVRHQEMRCDMASNISCISIPKNSPVRALHTDLTLRLSMTGHGPISCSLL
jgi:hypothetical protein